MNLKSKMLAAAIEPLESRRLLSTYYVSTSGSDDNSGLDPGASWRTIQHAADVARAGDKINVMPGEYAGFNVRTDGAAGKPITFKAQGAVEITSPNGFTNRDGINLEGANWIVIEGFTVNNMPRAGIRSVMNNHVTIRKNSCDSNGRWGIFTAFSDDLLIERNITTRSVDEHGIYVSNSGDRPVIRSNIVWGNRGNGIHLNGDATQGGDGIITGARVERNIIHDNGVGGGSAINGDGVQNSRFQNNLLYNNHASGISLYRIDGAKPSTGNLVVNNTIIQASDARWPINIRDGSTGNVVHNNVLYNNNSSRGSISVDADSLAGFSSDYNIVMNRFTTSGGDNALTLAQWRSTTGQDAHSIIATPSQLFANAGANDYRLASSSPALNAGTTSRAPSNDLEGLPRLSDDPIDIGAFELLN